jgi:hypothetical protein
MLHVALSFIAEGLLSRAIAAGHAGLAGSEDGRAPQSTRNFAR